MEKNVGYNIDIFADALSKKTAEQTRTDRFNPLYQSA